MSTNLKSYSVILMKKGDLTSTKRVEVMSFSKEGAMSKALSIQPNGGSWVAMQAKDTTTFVPTFKHKGLRYA
jgi:hypothetical protein